MNWIGENATCHSETGMLEAVFIKKVSDAFVNENQIATQWEALNYLGKPDFAEAVKEYDLFETIFQAHGIKVYHLPEDAAVTMDSLYCRDAAIATDAGMIICNMGKKARNNEPIAEKNAFVQNGIPVLGTITSPGTLEGGDVAWLDEHTLAVGHTYRTNEEGILQLKQLLKPIGVTVIVVPLPHYRGPSDVFHLMSIFSPVDSELAVVYSPLMPIVFRNELLNRGWKLVEVPDAEFESMGCNVLSIAPRICLMVEGNGTTKKSLEHAGCKVIEYKGAQISIKGGGGPTCLTRPLQRKRQ